ncbi:MAG: hypothetical protein PUG50_03040 [Eubacteriales bacterium]|uniref:hypothetical protein n=1 Tax=Fenollaria sp. TaxID=1965292 RepID=UPI002A75843B|nr:hypothetical protein [Fenollaria sp.]MDD7339545.1 hypothetical protein [Eubacteriales bacterium]MDY3105378.1 hypothetical protein [Fenollaria sp.]
MKKKSLAIAILLLLALLVISRIETTHSYIVIDEELGEVEMTLSKPIFARFYNKVTFTKGNLSKTKTFDGKYKLNIYKVDLGRVNDENKFDIAFGVYSIAPWHRTPSKRVFLYKVVDLDLKPKFRCSRLINPMYDFILYDIDGDGFDEVVSIEKYKGVYSIGVYKQYDLRIERIATRKIDFRPTKLIKNEKLYIESINIMKEINFSKEGINLK